MSATFKKRPQASLLLLGTLWAAAGCGSTAMKSSDSFQNGNQTPAQGSGDAQGVQQPLDCDSNTLWLHGDHDTCDQADIDAQNGKVTPAAQAPAVPAAAPAAGPAPAPAPEEAGTPAPTTASTTTTKDPNVVEFHIKAGTGNNGYNTAATPVTVKVGQTLRLFNDDTVVHRLHTSGVPCPHQPANTAPGASFDCVVTKAIDTTVAPGKGLVYDHDAGPTSLFYLQATP